MAAIELAERGGFEGVRLRDVAAHADVALGTLYRRFRSKEDLLFLINFGGFTTLNTAWRELVDTLEQPREKLYAFIYFHLGYFVEHMDEMRLMTWGTQVLHVEKARMIQKLKDQYTDALKEIVMELHKAGAGRDFDDKRLSRETYLLFGMMNWTFSWYDPHQHGSVAELIRDIYRTFLRGISNGEYDEGDLDRMESAVGEIFEQTKKPSMWARTVVVEPDH